jgi:hypothetical protein
MPGRVPQVCKSQPAAGEAAPGAVQMYTNAAGRLTPGTHVRLPDRAVVPVQADTTVKDPNDGCVGDYLDGGCWTQSQVPPGTIDADCTEQTPACAVLLSMQSVQSLTASKTEFCAEVAYMEKLTQPPANPRTRRQGTYCCDLSRQVALTWHHLLRARWLQVRGQGIVAARLSSRAGAASSMRRDATAPT